MTICSQGLTFITNFQEFQKHAYNIARFGGQLAKTAYINIELLMQNIPKP